MSPADWIILIAAVLCDAGAIAAWLYRRKKRCGGCGQCPHAGACGKQKKGE